MSWKKIVLKKLQKKIVEKNILFFLNYGGGWSIDHFHLFLGECRWNFTNLGGGLLEFYLDCRPNDWILGWLQMGFAKKWGEGQHLAHKGHQFHTSPPLDLYDTFPKKERQCPKNWLSQRIWPPEQIQKLLWLKMNVYVQYSFGQKKWNFLLVMKEKFVLKRKMFTKINVARFKCQMKQMRLKITKLTQWVGGEWFCAFVGFCRT